MTQTIWQIEWIDGAIKLTAYTVIKETDCQYHIQRPISIGRIQKPTIDREPGLFGGGKYYSSREIALETWFGYYNKRQSEDSAIATACLSLALDPAFGPKEGGNE